MLDATSDQRQQEHNSHSIQDGASGDGEFWRDELQETAHLFAAAASGDRAGVVKLLGEYILRTQVENARNKGRMAGGGKGGVVGGDRARGPGDARETAHGDVGDDGGEGDDGDEEENDYEEEEEEQCEEYDEDGEEYGEYGDDQYQDEAYHNTGETEEANDYYGEHEYGEGHSGEVWYDDEENEDGQHAPNQADYDEYEQPGGEGMGDQADEGDEQYFDAQTREKRVRFADEEHVADTDYQDEEYWNDPYAEYPDYDEGYHDDGSEYQEYHNEESEYYDSAQDDSYLQQGELPYMSGALGISQEASTAREESQQDYDYEQSIGAYTGEPAVYGNDYSYNQSATDYYGDDRDGAYDQLYGDPGYDDHYSQEQYEQGDNDTTTRDGAFDLADDRLEHSQHDVAEWPQQLAEESTDVDSGSLGDPDAEHRNELDQDTDHYPGREQHDSHEYENYQYDEHEDYESREYEEDDMERNLLNDLGQDERWTNTDAHDQYDLSVAYTPVDEERDLEQTSYSPEEPEYDSREIYPSTNQGQHDFDEDEWNRGYNDDNEQYYESNSYPYGDFEDEDEEENEVYYDSPLYPSESLERQLEEYDSTYVAEDDSEYNPLDFDEQYEEEAYGATSLSRGSTQTIGSSQTTSSAGYTSSQDDYATWSMKSQDRAVWYEDVEQDSFEYAPEDDGYGGGRTPMEDVDIDHNPAVEGVRFYDRYTTGSEEAMKARDARREERLSRRPQTLVDRFRTMYR